MALARRPGRSSEREAASDSARVGRWTEGRTGEEDRADRAESIERVGEEGRERG